MTQALTYCEIDVPHCANVYGNSPCTASLVSSPPTGTIKCFNCRNTCQDIVNYIDTTPVTYRFAKPASYLPNSIFAFPSITDVQLTPCVVSLGKDLGQRASVSVVFEDHPDDDTMPGVDPYLSERTYNPFSQGTFWGKFRARHPFIVGAKLRLIFGYVGQELEDMETRHYIVDSYEGPTPRGKFTLRASDVLKLGDAEKAQAPVPSPGYLQADITASAMSITVLPVGAGADYSAGYLNLGGSEIVEYWSNGDDQFNVMLLHGEGTDGSTTITNSAPTTHTATANGNAQIDNAQFKFGSTSIAFDGTTDYLLVNGATTGDFAFGTNDFTIEFWFRKNANGVNYHLYDGRPAATTGQYVTIYVSAGDNKVYYARNAVDQLSTNATTTATWYHVALSRQNGTTYLFLNGALAGSANESAVTLVNGTSRPIIGANGNSLGANSLNGWMDEIRISNVGRYGAAFTPATTAFPITSDVLYFTRRGRLNTTAATHNSGDRAQHVLTYISEDPADIVYDICTNYIPGFDANWIDLPTWQAETSTYNGNVYTGYVTEPTAVKTLLEELVLQCFMALWWDDVNEQLRLQVLHAIPTSAFDFTPDNMRRGSLGINENLGSRLSQVFVYFAQLNPLLQLSNKDNYKSSTLVEDTDAEENWGQPAIQTILSRWIPSAGRTVADRLGAILLGRYKTPPRSISFEVQRFADTDPVLGGGYHFACDFVQDETGATDGVFIPIQVTELKAAGDAYAVRAEEMLFDVPATDLTNRNVAFSFNNFNLNLRTEHDSIYPAPTGSETVTFTINAGVSIGSRTTATPAVDVGTWPAGTTIVIVLQSNARIQGKGGAGGAANTNGSAGGTALYTRKAMSLTNNGRIAGGGGGGGGGGGFGAGGGGGGSGTEGGAGGPFASAGTPDAGGAGGSSGAPATGTGGAGGGYGAAGSAGTVGGAGSGGAAGTAVDGTSFVTYTLAGTINGSQIN